MLNHVTVGRSIIREVTVAGNNFHRRGAERHRRDSQRVEVSSLRISAARLSGLCGEVFNCVQILWGSI